MAARPDEQQPESIELSAPTEIATRAAHEVLMSRLSFRTFDQVPYAVLATDLEGSICWANQACEHTSGYARDELVRQSITLLFTAEDDLVQRVVASVIGDGYWHGELACMRKDGTRGIGDVTIAPLYGEHERMIGALWTYHDITETQREIEQRSQAATDEHVRDEIQRARAEANAARQHMRDLFLQAPVCICVTRGPEHRVELINDAFRALYGWREFEGKTAREGWPELEGQGFFELLDQVYATGVPFVSHEIHARIDRHNDGELDDGYFTLVYQPARNAEGSVDGILVFATEVTEQVWAREAIRASEAKAQAWSRELEGVLDAMTDGVLVYDTNGSIIRTNSAVNRLFGYQLVPHFTDLPVEQRKERVRVRDADGRLLPVERLPQMRALAGETLMGPDAVDLRITTLYGTDIEVSTSASPLHDSEGNIVGAVAVYRDVTERRRLERAVAEQAARLDAIFETIADGVALYDTEGRLLRWNAAMEALFELDSMPDYAALPVSVRPARLDVRDAEEKPIPAEQLPFMRAARGELVTGASATDLLVTTPSGRKKQANVSAAPLRDERGNIVGTVAVYREVTVQRQLERRTRDALLALLALTETLVEIPDPSNRGTTPSQPAQEGSLAQRLTELTCAVLGCGRVSISAVDAATLLMHPVAVVGLTPEQESQWWAEQRELEQRGQRLGDGADPALLERLLAGEILVLDFTQPPYNTQPNPYRITTILAAPMRVGSQIMGVLTLDYNGIPHIFTDEELRLAAAVAQLAALVLERDRLLSEREAARAETLALAEANRRMNEFLGIAGHELRTPLTTIKANLQLAERRTQRLQRAAKAGDTRGSDDALEYLLRLVERTLTAINRHERLVHDLLDVSRISAGKLEYRMQPLDLVALTRDVIQEQRLTAPERQITLDLPAEPVMVRADGDRIGQVIANYLTNALKYSAAELPVVVRLERRAESGVDGALVEVARVSVRDQGPGLTEAQQQQLFQQFQRIEGIEVVTGSGVGLGLGLYISREIITQHDGRVGVESAVGKGSTFWFTLPLATG